MPGAGGTKYRDLPLNSSDFFKTTGFDQNGGTKGDDRATDDAR